MLLMPFVVAAAPVEPIGAWTVGDGDARCVLSRTFGPATAPSTIEIEPALQQAHTDIILELADASPDAPAGRATVTFDDGTAPIDGRFFADPAPGGRLRSHVMVEADLARSFRSATSLTLLTPPVSTTIPLTDAATAWRALEMCRRRLLSSWQVSEDALAIERAPVRRRDGKVAAPLYPNAAIKQRLEGRVVAALAIDASGLVTACRIVVPAAPVLNDATCARSSRTRFQPGTDAAGRPAASTYIMAVRYTFPVGE